jgi:hypothetical protein
MGPYGAGGIHPVPMIETNNTLSNPTGPEWQFLVGEGNISAWNQIISTDIDREQQEHTH